MLTVATHVEICQEPATRRAGADPPGTAAEPLEQRVKLVLAQPAENRTLTIEGRLESAEGQPVVRHDLGVQPWTRQLRLLLHDIASGHHEPDIVTRAVAILQAMGGV